MFQAAAARQEKAEKSSGDFFTKKSSGGEEQKSGECVSKTRRPSLQPRTKSELNKKINSTEGFEAKSSVLSLDDLSDDESMEATLLASDKWGPRGPSKGSKHSVKVQAGLSHDTFTQVDSDDDDIFVSKPIHKVKKDLPDLKSFPPGPSAPTPADNSSSSSTKRRWDFDEVVNNKRAPRRLDFEVSKKAEQSLEANTSSMTLSREQRQILDDVVVKGMSLFYTGAAGTGKSYLLHSIIGKLRAKYGDKAVAVCAPTGLAAINIRGETIHKWAGIGLGREDNKALAQKVRGNKKSKDRWLSCRTLVIDEVSMLSAELFDKLNFIAKHIRQDSSPFGGIQLVLTGDFFQLPPIVDRSSASPYVFKAKSWAEAIQHKVVMTQVFRQQSDTKFIDLLNQLRLNQITDEGERQYKALAREISNDDGIEPTQLFSRNHEVDSANRRRMDALGGPKFTYVANDYDENPANRSIYQSMIAPPTLELKLNAQVMLVKNQEDGGLVNGSRGFVKSFCTPLLELKLMDFLKDSHERLEAFNELICAGFDESKVKPQTRKLLSEHSFLKEAQSQYCRRNPTQEDYEWYPLVEFKTPDGGKTTKLVRREKTTHTDPQTKRTIAERIQVHLLPAWALSIHKAQGQTLDKVKVDVTSAFEKGQVYVAISRARTLDTLQVVGFDRSKVYVAREVVDFYKELSNPKI
ncbi:hypothetical protein TRICI_004611 [Trichomonascus ciferrii]|uniref:ATP-dependent DNA helicase PIF1 n=1 Tax=Trichomonascus ciferrii TaxID=44093 RepID=A0A642V5E7_9ASCO|nr:hypothetical protein TRICI_004611 [Trichomonascus ciferrii]